MLGRGTYRSMVLIIQLTPQTLMVECGGREVAMNAFTAPYFHDEEAARSAFEMILWPSSPLQNRPR